MKSAAAVALLFIFSAGNAQYYLYNEKYYGSNWVWEAGIGAGVINSLTDLGGRKGAGKDFLKDLNWRVTKPFFSMSVLATYKDAIALRLEAGQGNITSYDRLLQRTDPDLIGRYGRNLSFKSIVREFHLGLELHPLFFRTRDPAPYWSPYVITGVGYYHFNPEASLDGHWYELQPLRLEGQGFAEYASRKPYRLQQFNIPTGIGIRYEGGANLYIRLELTHRFLFTDYLDDVSNTYVDPIFFANYLPASYASIATRLYSRMEELQPGYKVNSQMPRGHNNNRDAFFTINVKVCYTLRPYR